MKTKRPIKQTTLISRNVAVEGETIETKIERIVIQKEPITDGAPLIYTDRKEGIIPAYDVRTDRFEVAIEAMDKVTKGNLAKREEYYKTKEAEAKPATPEGNQQS